MIDPVIVKGCKQREQRLQRFWNPVEHTCLEYRFFETSLDLFFLLHAHTSRCLLIYI